MRLISFQLVLLLSIRLSGQITGTVKDEINGLPVEYANIFLKDIPVGATADNYGNFKIESADIGDILVISAIGYESRQVVANSGYLTINLKSKVYELPGVNVSARKDKLKRTIGKFNNRNIRNYFICKGYPWMVSKIFEFKPEYYKTPFLKQLKILTSSSASDSAIFNLHLLSIDKEGNPTINMLGKNLIIRAQKGINKNTTIDLEKYNFTFPPSGLVVAVEWLLLDQNKTNWEFNMQYEPQFGALTEQGNTGTFNFIGGKWIKTTLLPPSERNKFKELAVELTLTN